MIEKSLIKEKIETQKRLDKLANHDLKQYFRNSQQNVEVLAKEYGVEIQYGNRKGGYLQLVERESNES